MMDAMRRVLLAATLVTLVAACTGAALSPSPPEGRTAEPSGPPSPSPEGTASLSPEPTVGATGVTSTIGIASSGPGATTKPGTTPGPSPKPSPKATLPPLDQPELRYRLVEELGRPLFCDPDFYPVAHDDEAALAQQHLAEIRADGPTWAAITAHLGIEPAATPTATQVLAIYREWKMLRALFLTAVDGRLGFDYVAAAGSNADTAWHVTGTIDASGMITLASRNASGPPPCPICLARGTRIATPDGERPVESLRTGMAVWTADRDGRRVVSRITAIGSTPVPATHEVVHLVLSDGRTVDVSPGHPLPDGRRVGDLRPGDMVDTAVVTSAALEAYAGGATFDLLPSGPTGTYWANGIHLASTLAAAR
jgi:hypothetical protein